MPGLPSIQWDYEFRVEGSPGGFRMAPARRGPSPRVLTGGVTLKSPLFSESQFPLQNPDGECPS